MSLDYVEQIQPRNVKDISESQQYIVGMKIPAHDYIGLTYVAAGNGAGEIETVTYKTGGASGTTLATLTLAYDANDKLETVTKS